MATATGQQIREELKQWGLLTQLGIATVDSTAADHLRDAARMKGRTVSPDTYHGAWIRLTAGGGDGEVSRIDEVDPSTGTIWVSPSFTTVPTTATTYEIYRPGLEPDEVDKARDKGLQYLCSRWQSLPVSIVTNADYLRNVTEGWTGSNTVLTRQAGTFPTELWPATMLQTNSAAAGCAKSASIYAIRGGDTFYLYVPVSVQSGTAQIIVRDVTSGADITLNGTASETRRGWSAFEVTGTVPATCDEIQVWLTGTESTAVIEWGPIFFTPQEWRRVQLPDRVDSKEKVGHVYMVTNFPEASGGGYWSEEARDEVRNVKKIQVNDSVHLQLSGSTVGLDLPYLYDERVFYQPLQTPIVTGTGIAFVDGAAGADTITDSASGLAVFVAGDVVTVSGSASNDGNFTIVSVVAGTITLATATVVAETAALNISITRAATYLTISDRTVGDAATTDCPIDYASAAMVKILCEQKLGADVIAMRALYGQIEEPQLGDEDSFWLKTLQLAEGRLGRAERLYGPEPQPTLERKRDIGIPYYRV